MAACRGWHGRQAWSNLHCRFSGITKAMKNGGRFVAGEEVAEQTGATAEPRRASSSWVALSSVRPVVPRDAEGERARGAHRQAGDREGPAADNTLGTCGAHRGRKG